LFIHEFPVRLVLFFSLAKRDANAKGDPMKAVLKIILASTLKYWSMDAWVCPTIRK
jgi:hypothetical protein